MFKPVGSLIKSLPKRSKTPEALSALMVRQIAREVLAEICRDFPVEVEKTVKVTAFKNKTLTIVAPTLVLAELQMRSGGLKNDINRRVGKRIVNSLFFRVS